MSDTYYASSLTGEQIEQVLENPVLTTSQSLTESQKTNARNNIGAYSKGATGIPLSDLSTDIVNRLVPIASGEDGQVLIKSNMFGSAWSSGYVQSVDGQTGQAYILPLGGTTGQVLKKASNSNYDVIWGEGGGGGGGGTSDYIDLSNKPQINGVTLSGNKTSADLGIGSIFYGECSTAYATDAKEVTISGITAYANGLSVRVKFQYASSANTKTLNVNNLGAKTIVGGAAVGWNSDDVIDFVYSNNYWYVASNVKATNSRYGNVQFATSSLEDNSDKAVSSGVLRSFDSGVVTGLQEYNPSETHDVGEHVRYNNNIYECNTTISTPEAWNSSHWTLLKPMLKLLSVYRQTITLSTTWSGSDPYTQTVTLPGINRITANTKFDIQPDATVIAQMVDDGVKALYIENNNGTLTAYAIGAAPTVSLSVQVTYYETTQGGLLWSY